MNKINDVPGYRVATFQISDAARAKTEILDCFLNALGIGTYLYSNAGGGRGLVIPTSLPMPVQLFNWTRKRWLDRWLAEPHRAMHVPLLKDAAWVYISARAGRDVRTIFLLNAIFETYRRLSLHLPPEWTRMKWSVELHGRDKEGSITVDGTTMTVDGEFVGQDWMMLVAR